MRYKKLILFIVLLLPTFAFGGDKQYGDIEVDKVWRAFDGDTITVSIKGYPAIIGDHISIRVYGIDTPEIRGSSPRIKAMAKQAKRFTSNKLREGNKIILKNIRRGKYFRIVAEVWIDGINLSDELMKNGLAKEYYGGKKPKW